MNGEDEGPKKKPTPRFLIAVFFSLLFAHAEVARNPQPTTLQLETRNNTSANDQFRGMENGNFRNGNWTAEAVEERRWYRSLVKAFASGI